MHVDNVNVGFFPSNAKIPVWISGTFQWWIKRVSERPEKRIITEFFGNFRITNFRPFDCPPWIPGIFGWMVRFSKIHLILDFLVTFKGISVIFDWMESACYVYFLINGHSLQFRCLGSHTFVLNWPIAGFNMLVISKLRNVCKTKWFWAYVSFLPE